MATARACVTVYADTRPASREVLRLRLLLEPSFWRRLRLRAALRRLEREGPPWDA